MVLTTKRAVPSLDISLDGTSIHQTATHKHLGVTFNSRLTWSENTDCIVKKASKKIGLLRRIRRRVPSLVIRSMYLTCIRPVLEYACGSWGGLPERNTQRLERVQRSAARLIAGVSVTDHLPHDILLARAGLETLARRRDMILVAPVYRLTRQTPSGPRHLCEAFDRWKAEPL